MDYVLIHFCQLNKLSTLNLVLPQNFFGQASTMYLHEHRHAIDTMCLVILPADSVLKGKLCHYCMHENSFDFTWVGKLILFDMNGESVEIVYTGGSQHLKNCDLWCINHLKYPGFISKLAAKKNCNIIHLMVKFDLIRFHTPDKIPPDMEAYSKHVHEINKWYSGLFM